jgi:hypothetical protein
MPLHCIIIVAPPSCPFVALACRCLLRHLYRWHLCCASLFWLIAVFTPLSCLLPPPSPRRRIRHQCRCQRLGTTGIRISEQRKRGQCHHANGQTARRERAADRVSSLLSESRRRSKNCFGGSAEGSGVGVVAVTIAISIAVAVYIIFAAVTAAAAASGSFAAS